MFEKQRLINALTGEAVDRPPVICPGGMMNASVTEMLQDIEANHNIDLETMVEVSKRIYTMTGFENFGVPFDMTVEAEPLGPYIDYGDKEVEPRVLEYSNETIEEIISKYKVVPAEEKRMGITLDAIGKLKNDQVPVIGNITGHISTATSVLDPLVVFRMFRKEPDRIQHFFEFINHYSKEYAMDMIRRGADVIALSDPTATGEILGAKNFERFAVPFYKDIIDTIHQFKVPVIVHICGNANSILESLNHINADALSFDSMVSMKHAKTILKSKLMGNVNTQLLHMGEVEKVRRSVQHCIESGVEIISPACGLSMATPVQNLRAMTDYVRKEI